VRNQDEEIIRCARALGESVNAMAGVVTVTEASLLLRIFIECEDGFTLKSIDDKAGPWVSIDDATKGMYKGLGEDDSKRFLEQRESLLRLSRAPEGFVDYAQNEGIEHFKLTEKGHRMIDVLLAPGLELLTEKMIED